MRIENKEDIKKFLEYNTSRKPLILSEYGRHFQKFIDQIKNIEDREERNKATKLAIHVMGEMNPHLRDVPDFQHKLWDQLFTMANFDLDVDSPYPIPTSESVKIIPYKIDYPQQKPKYRFYGNNIKAMIEEAISWEDGEKKEGLIYAIANHMKKCYLNWNKDTVDDEVIFRHLYELSNGEINLMDEDESLSSTKNLMEVSRHQNNRFSNFVSKTKTTNNYRKQYNKKRY